MYWLVPKLFLIWCVLYKIDPDAKTIIPTENHKPKSKLNNIPATIAPNATKNPMAKMLRKKEKSAFVLNTTKVNPKNKLPVIITACVNNAAPSV